MLERDHVSDFNSYSWMARIHKSEAIVAGRLEETPTGTSMAEYMTSKATNTLYATNKNNDRLVNGALESLIG